MCLDFQGKDLGSQSYLNDLGTAFECQVHYQILTDVCLGIRKLFP